MTDNQAQEIVDLRKRVSDLEKSVSDLQLAALLLVGADLRTVRFAMVNGARDSTASIEVLDELENLHDEVSERVAVETSDD